jgi:hypothetical protein
MPVFSERQAREILRRQQGHVHLPAGLEARVDPPDLGEELALLRSLIRKHAQTDGAEKLLVTPKLAAAMLHMMGKNRKLSRVWVERWKRSLVEDRWWGLPNQGMGFDWNGMFRDGQHRATAIKESGITAAMWVAFGVDPAAFWAMDTGLRRNAAQNLVLDEIHHAHHVSHVVRLRFRTENRGEMPDDEFVHREGVRLMAEAEGGVLECAIQAGHKLRKEHRGVTLSSAALAYWLIAKHSKRGLSVDGFFDQLGGDGANLPGDSPIHRLRRKFLALPTGRKAKQYLSQTQHAAWIILAWNAWIAGRRIPTSGTGSRWPNWTYEHVLPQVDSKE